MRCIYLLGRELVEGIIGHIALALIFLVLMPIRAVHYWLLDVCEEIRSRRDGKDGR